MLEFGNTGANMGANAGGSSDLVKDSDEANFMADVVDVSQETPVIVDFWAPWCGPCKTLGPALEKAVADAKGAVRMVKIDVDQNQQIAAQLRIQSVPTVYGFYKGQPIDGFQGAVTPSEIKAFVDRLIAASGGGADDGLGEAIEAAEQMLTEGAATDAAQTFAAVLGEEPSNAAAYGGLVRAHLAMGETDQAKTLLDGAPDEIAKSPELEAVRAQLDLALQAAEAGPVAELRAELAEDPSDMQAQFDLAIALHASGEVQEAVDLLLDLFRRDRDWNDGAAKTQLFTIFDALKPQDPIALNGRRKLSSMIFL